MSLTISAHYSVTLSAAAILECIKPAALEEIKKWHPDVTSLVDLYFDYSTEGGQDTAAIGTSKEPFSRVVARVKAAEVGFFKEPLATQPGEVLIDVEIFPSNVTYFLSQEARKKFGGATERMEIQVHYATQKVCDCVPPVETLASVTIRATPKK